jgi:predicted DNA-binding WGR domain protein
MRSFEFVDGASAKFWEIDQDGTEVTLRWGRVGTAGQTKVKTFDSAAEAAAQEGKLIADKLRKGYGETTTTTAAAPPARTVAPESVIEQPAADEDTFVFPAAWHRHRHARRGGSGVGRFVPDPQARAVVDELINRAPSQVDRALQAAPTDMAIALAGVAWREGDPQAPPIGAAAVAAVASLGNWDAQEKLVAFADVWMSERGLRFAAEAAAELLGLQLDDGRPPGRPRNSNQQYGVRILRPGEKRRAWWGDPAVHTALRVRGALAAASDEEYAEAIEALTPYRTAGAYVRAATSVLVPTQQQWVAQDIEAAIADGDESRAAMLLTAAGTTEQVTALMPVAPGYAIAGSLPTLTTLVDGVGAGAAQALFHWFDSIDYADSQRRLLSVLSVLPSDEVMRGLVARIDAKYVAPALLDAANRQPARALRMLAEGAARPAVAELLRAHVLAHPAVVERVLPLLDPEPRARVEAIRERDAAIVAAPLEAVPPLLLDPPWRHRERVAKPVVITGLACTDPPSVSWLDGERESWLKSPYPTYSEGVQDWGQVHQRIATGTSSWYEPAEFFAGAPEELARPFLAQWRIGEIWQAASWMRVVVARFELDALPVTLEVVRRSPAELMSLLLPYAAPEIAVLMADAYARLKTVRETAVCWLQRHATAAARALVPAALDKAGVPRRQAEQALLALHTNGHTEAVRAAAQSYGDAAAAAIQTLLDTDPLAVLPVKLPAMPAWAVPGLLPPVLLRDGRGALPAEAVSNLVMVLALGRTGVPYAGVDVVREACDPESLAEFAWGLFQRWQTASGGDSKENWVLDILGVVGDDETVRRLTPLILAWPGEGGHARAVTGVQVLARIGTDVALMHLHGIAQRAKFKGLKAAAQQKMADVAAGLGLSADQLADRLVPQFGLDEAGSMVLDYGSRQFTVGFDEQLRPYVADGTGKRLKALPKPGARDDAELAPAAYKQFAALKKDVRTVAADQIRRLERAMVTSRRWSGAEFRQLFVDHPLLWHIVRRLVWGVYDENGRPAGAIRVAEDRSFSDVHDDEMQLADDARVGVAHPLHLGDTLADWVEVFADYEILQPFAQLSRETFSFTAEEAATTRLTRFEGRTVPTGRVIGLERKGWRRETPQDAGIQGYIELELGPDQAVVIGLDPGIAIGAMDVFPEQKLESISLNDSTGGRWHLGTQGQISLGRLDPVAASELIRDLTELTA